MITKPSLLTQKLNEVKNDAEHAAREIYYAMSFLEYDHPSRANLELALQSLGVWHPEEVGLSSRVLTRRIK